MFSTLIAQQSTMALPGTAVVFDCDRPRENGSAFLVLQLFSTIFARNIKAIASLGRYPAAKSPLHLSRHSRFTRRHRRRTAIARSHSGQRLIKLISTGLMQFPGTFTQQMQHMGMVPQHGGPVRDTDQRGAALTQARIQRRFIGAVQRAGRLIENDNAGRVDQNAGECMRCCSPTDSSFSQSCTAESPPTCPASCGRYT